MNPWHLTDKEARLLDAVCRCGLLKVAAAELGIANNTAKGHMKLIQARMGERRLVRVCLKWSAWRAGREPLRLVA